MTKRVDNPYDIPAMKFTRGKLFNEQQSRTRRKSAFLRKLEKSQTSPDVITLDDARRNALAHVKSQRK